MKERRSLPVPRDVRMKGFSERATVAAATDWIDSHSCALELEQVALGCAWGRVLAQNVQSALDVPSFTRSAMDGYALRGAETVGAGSYNPLPFRVLGESMPGKPFPGEVTTGTAVRIMTGAPLPHGADAVLPAEFVQTTPDPKESDRLIEALAAVSPGKNVGPRGEDVAAGSIVLHAGRRLRPQDLGLLASIGMHDVPLVRQPRVRLLATGNELASPGKPRGEYQIVDANSGMLQALVARDGGIIESAFLLHDDRELICHQLGTPGADVILVSGGSSVGAEDHAPTLVAEIGQLAIHGIAMRPSSPAGIGNVGTALVFLLPGNPVSCLCAYDFFAGRAIRRLGGRNPDWPYTRRVCEVRRKVVSTVGRVDYVRVRLVDGKVEPLATSGASILSSTTRADGFLIVPAESEGFPPGAQVEVLLYDSPY